MKILGGNTFISGIHKDTRINISGDNVMFFDTDQTPIVMKAAVVTALYCKILEVAEGSAVGKADSTTSGVTDGSNM